MLPALLVAGGVAVFLGLAGGLLTTVGPWYHALRKPSWQPPDWLFGPAWTVILGMAAWSAALGWTLSPETGRWPVLLAFGANAVFHLLWSPLFFTVRRPDWALAEVPFLWLSIVAAMVVVAPVSALAAALLLPYLLWVSFATVLNWRIVQLNRPFGRLASAPSPAA